MVIIATTTEAVTHEDEKDITQMLQDEEYTALTNKVTAILGTGPDPDKTVTPTRDHGSHIVMWYINEPALPVDDEGEPLEADEPPHTLWVALYVEGDYIWASIHDRALVEPRPSVLAVVGLCALYCVDCRLSTVADSLRFPFSDLDGEEVSESEAACARARLIARAERRAA